MSEKSKQVHDNLAIQLPEWAKYLLAALFMLLVYVFSRNQGVEFANHQYLIIAAVIGAYMAINIGANDVANNVGPIVGSGALTLFTAIIIAAIFEALGALIAGGEVVETVKKGIIQQEWVSSIDNETFIWLMLSALIAAGIWLNAATAIGAPVSTTHSIVGGVLGAGVFIGGVSVVDWQVMTKIASSWVISPLMGGAIAAGLLYFIKYSIYYRDDRLAAANKVIPGLIALMCFAFTTYLLIKGTKQIFQIAFIDATLIGAVVAIVVWIVVKPLIAKATLNMSSKRSEVNELFTIPLIISAAILSFAHGANDVANAVGPLAAINDAVIQAGEHASKAAIPMWVMLVGALGISIGLMLFGPKLIHTVGTGITDINKARAYCVAMSASSTVIIASQLGIPISSTHVAVGAVFGVGFLREILTADYNRIIDEVREHYHESQDHAALKFLAEWGNASAEEKTSMLKALKQSSEKILTKKDRKALKKSHKERLVQRGVFIKIIAAWFITVPCSALLSALIYYLSDIFR